MPSLKDLVCSVELAPGRDLKEYMSTYGDGFVETFIAVPDDSKTFAVHLNSTKYISEGLAMYVFIDGIYQCNRNRIGLEDRRKSGKPLDSRTIVDFRVRQKEEKQNDGTMIARGWKFEKLNIASADGAPNVCSSNIAENVGCIEVIILRCKGARGPSHMGFDGPSDEPTRGSSGSSGRWVYDDRDWQTAARHSHASPQGSHSHPAPNCTFGPPPADHGSNSRRHSSHRSRPYPEQHTPSAPGQTSRFNHRSTLPPIIEDDLPRRFWHNIKTAHTGPTRKGRSPEIEYGFGPVPPSREGLSEVEQFRDRTPSDISIKNPIVDPKWLNSLLEDAYKRGAYENQQKHEKDGHVQSGSVPHYANSGVHPPLSISQSEPLPPYSHSATPSVHVMNAPEAKLSCPSGPSGHQSENKGMLQTERPAKHKSIPRTSLIPGSWPHADDGPYDSWDTEDSWEKKENSSEDTSGSSRKSSASQDWDQIGSPNTQPLPITRCKRPSNSPLKADGMKQEGPSVKWNDSGWDKKSLASTDSWGKKSDSDMISPKTAVPGSQNRQSWSDSQKEAQNYPSSWSSKHQQPPWNIGSAANTTEKKGKKLSNSWGVPFAVDAPAFATEPRHTSSRKRDSVKTTQAVASPVPVPCHQQRDSTPLSAFGIPVESILRLLSIGSKASTHVKTSAKKDLRNVTDEKPVEGRADGSNNPGEFKQKVKQNSPNDKTQVKGETDQHKSSWETGESKPEEAVEADTWDNGSGDVKEVENQGGTDWNNDSSGGTTWNNDNNEQSGEPTWGETAANDNQATGFGDTWGEEENKSTKPTSNSSKPRHHSSRHAVPSIIPKQHWSFPPPPPPRKFYPIPEEYKSTASNIRHSELWMFPAEPPLTIPTSAQKSGLEHHVQAGKGTQYIHHVGRPEYKDSFQNPYAVFRFKYRTRSFLRKQFGSDVVPVKESELIEDEEAEKARLKALGVQGLIEEILKLKADLKARGSNATPPSHVRDWVGEQRERSKKTHSSRVSSKKAGEENMGWREEGHGEKEELKPAWDRKSRGGSKKAESKVGSLVVGWADLQSGSKKAESEKRSRAGSRKASQVKGDWNRGDNEPEGNW